MRRLGRILVLAMLATGCAVPTASPTGSVPAADAAAAEEAAVTGEDRELGSSDDAAATEPADGSPRPTSPPSDDDGTDSEAAASADGSTSTPASQPTSAAQQEPATAESPAPLEFEVSLSATCVAHGAEVTIEVLIEPDASVAYHAVYAGEEGGAVPPYGEGHGGNDGGPADSQGRYVDTWVVGASAPEGPARVDVAVASFGQMGRTQVGFEVAERLTGTCGQSS